MTSTLNLSGAHTVQWKDALPDGATGTIVVFGRDEAQVGAVQIAVATTPSRPTKSALTAMWHPEIHLGVFYPSEYLDEYLKLEKTLIRKLKQADAAVGTGVVLPGVSAFPPKDHYDADDLTAEIQELVDTAGGSAAGSGEEYRRRLLNALAEDPSLQQRLTDLPLGVGSGFENPAVEGNVFVFCMRMGDTGRVWFRNVRAGADWSPATDAAGAWLVEDDTLDSLVSADPGSADRERILSDEAFRAAYDAWAIAREHAHEEWQQGTDPNAMAGAIPTVFREAMQVVMTHGGHLGDRQLDVVRRLQTVPSAKARKAMRGALRASAMPAEQIIGILRVLDEFGIQPAAKVEPLPTIDLNDIRLVAWTAVRGTKDSATHK